MNTNTITIENNGANIKITQNNVSRFIYKDKVREIEIVKGTIIRIDIGQGALKNLFVDQANVTLPASNSVANLRDLIIAMLEPVANNNNNGEAEELAAIQALTTVVTNLKTKVDSLDDKIFYQPRMVDESEVNVVYNGFAVPGSNPEANVWAIQRVTFANQIYTYEWAGGTKAFDKIWIDRTQLAYN